MSCLGSTSCGHTLGSSLAPTTGKHRQQPVKRPQAPCPRKRAPTFPQSLASAASKPQARNTHSPAIGQCQLPHRAEHASSPRAPLPSRSPHAVSADAPPSATSSADPPPPLLSLVPETHAEELNLDLVSYDPAKHGRNGHVDLVVVGAGPAGLGVACRVADAGLSVCCVDPYPTSVWPNNYGVWVDEFEAMGIADCLDYVWPKAVVYLDDGKEKFLDRPYGRVDRRKLKTTFAGRCTDAGVAFHKAKVDSVEHQPEGSVVRCADGTTISATLVLDATGFSRRLVQYAEPPNPGYQVAWGIVAEVDSHPFDLDKMVFMDWRDSHLHGKPELLKSNAALPTFLYAMPLSPTRVFLEETSLVARPAISFDDCKKRMEARLAHLGITVRRIEEEEYCLIPMGGVLPTMPQRVLGIGGTVGMVHPSTGYMVARTLGASPVVADSIIAQLQKFNRAHQSTSSRDSSSISSSGGGGSSGCIGATTTTSSLPAVDELAAAVWQDIWPLERKEQREFFCFGMDVLLRLDLYGNRRFFDAFFDLSPHHWQGFLSSRLYLAELIGFGLSLFAHATTPARLEIMAKGLPGLSTLLGNVVKMRTNP